MSLTNKAQDFRIAGSLLCAAACSRLPDRRTAQGKKAILRRSRRVEVPVAELVDEARDSVTLERVIRGGEQAHQHQRMHHGLSPFPQPLRPLNPSRNHGILTGDSYQSH